MISVIIPYSSDETYLIRCLNAIMYQTYKQTEILLISENKKKYKELEQKYPLRVIETKEQDRHAGIREAIDTAAGNYVFFCQMTSVPAPNTLEALINCAEEDESVFTDGTCYVSNGKAFTPVADMSLNFYGKLLKKDYIDKDIFSENENSDLSEYLMVLRYLKHFDTVERNEDIYIYQTEDAFPGSFSNETVDEETCLLIPDALAELSADLRNMMKKGMITYLTEKGIVSETLMVICEEKCHADYELNFAVAQPVLSDWWDNIQSGNETEKIYPFREYLRKYEKEKEFLALLLESCGLNKKHYDYLWQDDIDNMLFLIKSSPENLELQYMIEKTMQPLQNEMDGLKQEFTDLNTKVTSINSKQGTTVKKQGLAKPQTSISHIAPMHILEIEDFVIAECRGGRVGFKTLLKFIKAWFAYKVRRGGV